MAGSDTGRVQASGFARIQGDSVTDTIVALTGRMASGKCIVYVLKNIEDVPRDYVGLTSAVHARLDDHNAGRCAHTARYRPWQLHVVIEFADEATAIRFERYLKSGSGREFAKRHFEA